MDPELGSGLKNGRIKCFRARLALWAKNVHELWTVASEDLSYDEKTLRQDVALLDEA